MLQLAQVGGSQHRAGPGHGLDRIRQLAAQELGADDLLVELEVVGNDLLGFEKTALKVLHDVGKIKAFLPGHLGGDAMHCIQAS